MRTVKVLQGSVRLSSIIIFDDSIALIPILTAAILIPS